MANVLSTVIVLIAVFAVLRKIKKNGDTDGTTVSRTRPASAPVRKQGFTNYRPHKDITSVSRDMGDKRSSVLKDDKNNDWLARQLRDEHKAFKATSEMFDLKIEHASHCDARLMAQFHRRNCDANGIDLANGTTVVK